MENQKTQFPDGKIELLNGTILDCYPLELVVGESVVKKTPDDDFEVEQRFFIENAFLLFNNRQQILSDSRMFLAPVKIGFKNSILGVFIEWWLNCPPASYVSGRTQWLIFSFAGSPYTGSNKFRAVSNTGEFEKDLSSPSFGWLNGSFKEIDRRYAEVKQRFQAYTKDEVVEILKKNDFGYADEQSVEVFQLKKEIKSLKIRIDNGRRSYAKQLPNMDFGNINMRLEALNQQYQVLANKLTFNNFSPKDLWTDGCDNLRRVSELLPNKSDRIQYIRLLRLFVERLKAEERWLDNRYSGLYRKEELNLLKSREKEAKKLYEEYKILENRRNELRERTDARLAELKRQFRSGKIESKEYQRERKFAQKNLSKPETELILFELDLINTLSNGKVSLGIGILKEYFDERSL